MIYKAIDTRHYSTVPNKRAPLLINFGYFRSEILGKGGGRPIPNWLYHYRHSPLLITKLGISAEGGLLVLCGLGILVYR